MEPINRSGSEAARIEAHLKSIAASLDRLVTGLERFSVALFIISFLAVFFL